MLDFVLIRVGRWECPSDLRTNYLVAGYVDYVDLWHGKPPAEAERPREKSLDFYMVKLPAE